MEKMEVKFRNFLVKLNWLYEAIVTTYKINPSNEKIKYNAAPMGVIFQDKEHLIIRPYLNTNTLKNIQYFKCAGINFTNNIFLFYKSAIKKSDLTINDFIESKERKTPLLKDSKIRFEVVSEKINVNKNENRATVHFKIGAFEDVDSTIDLYSRGYFAALESIIHFTRVNILMEQDPEKGKKLIQKILDYNVFIKRVYPNSDLEKITNEIVFKINKMQ